MKKKLDKLYYTCQCLNKTFLKMPNIYISLMIGRNGLKLKQIVFCFRKEIIRKLNNNTGRKLDLKKMQS